MKSITHIIIPGMPVSVYGIITLTEEARALTHLTLEVSSWVILYKLAYASLKYLSVGFTSHLAVVRFLSILNTPK